MKILFLTEMGFVGKVHRTHDNMRVEFAWMASMGAEHNHLGNYEKINYYSDNIHISDLFCSRNI